MVKKSRLPRGRPRIRRGPVDMFSEQKHDIARREYIETWGIRSLTYSLPDDENYLIPAKIVNPISASQITERLNRFACSILASHGELDFLQSIERVLQTHGLMLKSGELSAAEARKNAQSAIKTSLQNFIETRGSVSPVSEAAKFVCSNMSFIYGMIPAGGELNEIYELCQAWHWLHMEMSGEHSKALHGVKQTANLASASSVRTKKKEERLAIVNETCQELWKRRPELRAASTAHLILEKVNKALTEKKHSKYTEETLEKVIRKIWQGAAKRNAIS